MIISNRQQSQPLYKYSLPFRRNRFRYIYVGRQQKTFVQITFIYYVSYILN